MSRSVPSARNPVRNFTNNTRFSPGLAGEVCPADSRRESAARPLGLRIETEQQVTDATSASGHADPAGPRAYAGVLAECRELIRTRACSALTSLLAAMEEDIEARKLSALDPDEEKMLAELQIQLRLQGEELERSFASAFEHAFSALSKKKTASASTLYGDNHRSDIELSLVDDQAFSEALTVKGQANVLYGACESELKDLLPRFALMLGSGNELEAADNPAGPEAVSEALKEACWSLTCPRAAKEMLFEMITRKLAPELNTIYRDVNQHLIVRRVLPRIRHGVKQGGVEKRRPSSRPRPADLETDAADVLRQLLTPGGSGDGLGQTMSKGAGAISALGGKSQSNPGVMQMLTRLQQGESEVTFGDGSFSIDATAAATMNVLHGLLDAGIGKNLGQVDNIVIDVVATLFDFIFDDARVPEAMKGLIGRMQLPVLKLALGDHSFFSNRNHPARRLINAMAQSSSTWDGALTPDSSLYKAAEPLVLRIQNEACEDSSVFASCLDAFEAFLAEQEKLADQKAAALTSRLTAREQLEIARTVAEGAIAGHAADQNTPEAVRSFLAEYWLGVLTEAARSGGEDGSVWNERITTMDDLVWSVRPKHGAEERQRLVKVLPKLLGGLKNGLETTQVDLAVREAFFAELVKLHAVAIRAGMALPTPPVAISSPEGTQTEEATHASQPQAAKTATTAHTPPPEPEPDADELDALQRGTWIELKLENSERRAVRLTWISPARTMYLFANRQGQRALALTRAELTRKFNSGDALFVDDEPLMDRLVSDVLDDYRPASSGAVR